MRGNIFASCININERDMSGKKADSKMRSNIINAEDLLDEGLIRPPRSCVCAEDLFDVCMIKVDGKNE